MSADAILCWIAAAVCLWAWIAAAYHEYRARLAQVAAERAAEAATAVGDPAQTDAGPGKRPYHSVRKNPSTEAVPAGVANPETSDTARDSRRGRCPINSPDEQK